ncbi:hypothetical protein RI129_005991 [Pyrocoelia pectoralis]|uniref:G-protein coupled receptors family 2 profile 2 domain-containing protein n=1 Tax=Pyrocoelia pectoralis TaxID=417401 RepID=A0AAN7ZP34_9COLE
MADPTIQTFCCYNTNGNNSPWKSENTLLVATEFNSSTYNAICLFSSTLGIIGAIYQILPRREFSRHHRWISFSAERGRKIILWLAITDLLASLGVLIRACLWLNYKDIMPAIDGSSSVIFCALSSAWIQYFYTSTWVWTLCYAIDMRLILNEKSERIKLYHIAAWIIPAILTAIGLSLLYYPDANCRASLSKKEALLRILPNYIVTYIPIAVVMIASPCLYLFSCKDMEKIITYSSGQFTRSEREVIGAIRIKFSVINIVFYVCWLPNLLNAFLLWTLWFQLPVTLVIITFYVMAFTNPLQAFFNCLVYRRWNTGSEEVVFPWGKSKSSGIYNTTRSRTTDSQEDLPLLHNFERNGPNLYLRS